MKVRGRKRLGIAFLGALTAGLLFACSAAEETKLPPSGTPPAATAVGMNNCVTCHLGSTQEWLLTRHANLDPNNPSNLDYLGNPTLTDINGICAKRCHDPDLDDTVGTFYDSDHLSPGVTGSTNPLIKRPVVGCEACHGLGSNHNGRGNIGPSRRDTGNFGGSTPVSGWFNTCNDCHELLDTTTGGVATPTTDHSTLPPPPPASQYIITDTHYATPGTYDATGRNSAPITGYAMDYASESVCSNCHNSHNSSMMDINRAWHQSKHGGDWTADGAWAHYNWTCTVVDCGATSGRGACQRCKTTAGFAAYADALAAKNTAAASGIYIGCNPPLAYDAAFKPQMIECNGCHKDNRGTLRNPGAVKAPYDIWIPSTCGTRYASVPYQYPDLGGSNICILCHAGRRSGDAVKGLNKQGLTLKDFSTAFSFRDAEAHDFSSAGVMFTAVGYEYTEAGRDYTNPPAYKHDKIGTKALSIDSGRNGPCVGCHMYRTGSQGSHLFLAVSKNDTIDPAKITSVTSDVCFNMNCHPGSNTAFAGETDTERLEFEDALNALCNQLESNLNVALTPNGVCPNVTSPFFNAAGGWLSTGDTANDGSVTGKNNYGAVFNFAMLLTEPGAYVHNSKYTRRLIYDSIDWIDNNRMDYSVGTTLKALGAVSYKTGAMTYLLPRGVLGFEDERP